MQDNFPLSSTPPKNYCVRVGDDLSSSLPTQAVSVLCYTQFNCIVFYTHVLVDINAASVVGFIHEYDSTTEVGKALEGGPGTGVRASPRDVSPCGVCGKKEGENVGQVEGEVAISLAGSFSKEIFHDVRSGIITDPSNLGTNGVVISLSSSCLAP